jgi:hypothetical protein
MSPSIQRVLNRPWAERLLGGRRPRVRFGLAEECAVVEQDRIQNRAVRGCARQSNSPPAISIWRRLSCGMPFMSSSRTVALPVGIRPMMCPPTSTSKCRSHVSWRGLNRLTRSPVSGSMLAKFAPCGRCTASNSRRDCRDDRHHRGRAPQCGRHGRAIHLPRRAGGSIRNVCRPSRGRAPASVRPSISPLSAPVPAGPWP